jgi:hypothetical protein
MPGGTTGFQVAKSGIPGGTTGFQVAKSGIPGGTTGFHVAKSGMPGGTTGFQVAKSGIPGGTTGFQVAVSSVVSKVATQMNNPSKSNNPTVSTGVKRRIPYLLMLWVPRVFLFIYSVLCSIPSV